MAQEYTIVKQPNYMALIDEVNNALHHGWFAIGGLVINKEEVELGNKIVTRNVYYQSLVRERTN